MRKIQCDICGAQFTTTIPSMEIEERYEEKGVFVSKYPQHYDLCRVCLSKLKQFIEKGGD